MPPTPSKKQKQKQKTAEKVIDVQKEICLSYQYKIQLKQSQPAILEKYSFYK